MSDPFSPPYAIIAGRYRIDSRLGEGGMALVFLAEDQRHQRKVAIKVLRAELSASLGAARFLREIQIAAQLQHPHILPLLDSGEASGRLFYVMPFVEASSLRMRLDEVGTMPISDAVRILADVVDALAYAHERNVVHRDIKPDNILLSARHALVADFGVAKAVNDASEAQALTTLGMALGTPRYMAPEQATAQPDVDHRVDIYAVGAMAYEMLTGRTPFVTSTARQMLAAQVMETPEPVSKHRPEVMPALDAIVMRCLAKEPDDRWQSADELLAHLAPIITSSENTPAGSRQFRRVTRRRVGLAVTGTLALIAFGFTSAVLLRRDGPPISLGVQTHLTTDPGLEIHPALSPDGRFIAYVAAAGTRMRVMVQPTSVGRAIPLFDDTTASIQAFPRWSPDGSQILFMAKRAAYVASALGGQVRQVIPMDSTRITTAVWSPDGREIAYARDRADSLLVRSVDGASSRFLTQEREIHSCDWSPRRLLIACVSIGSAGVFPSRSFGSLGPSNIEIFPLSGGKLPFMGGLKTNLSPVWTEDGRWILFVSNFEGSRDLYARRVSANGAVIGKAIKLTTGLEALSISLSADDRLLAYSRYTATANIWSVPIPAGAPVSISTAIALTTGSQVVEQVSASRDGKWVYFDSNLRGAPDAFRVSTAGGEPEQFSPDSRNEWAPTGSPDGREVAFHTGARPGSKQRDIWVQSVDGTPAQHVTSSDGHEVQPVWSPDGQAIAFNTLPGRDLFIVRRDTAGLWQKPVLRAKGLSHSQWSPDGRRLLARGFRSNGEPQIVVLAVDSGDAKVVYSRRPGTSDPLPDGFYAWSADGRSIYLKSYEPQAGIWSFEVNGGRPRILVRFDDVTRQSRSPYFATDGKRFYFTIDDHQSDIWLVELKR